MYLIMQNSHSLKEAFDSHTDRPSPVYNVFIYLFIFFFFFLKLGKKFIGVIWFKVSSPDSKIRFYCVRSHPNPFSLIVMFR